MAVPDATPVTSPPDVTDAIPGALVLHVPPEVASVKVVLLPAHTTGLPAIAAGDAVTVISLVTVQPLPNE